MGIKIKGQTVINDDYTITLKKAGNGVSDHLKFYNGNTQVGEIGVEDNSWLRINQETDNNIYTPRMIRADGGYQVDAITIINNAGGVMNLASDADLNKGISIRGTNSPGYDPWTATGWAGATVTQWNTNQNIELNLKVKQSLGQDLNYMHTPGNNTDNGSETKGFTHIGGITLQWGCTGFLGDIANDHYEAVTFAIPWEGIANTLPEVMSITTGMITDRPDFNHNIDGNLGVANLTKTGFNFRFDEWGSVPQQINFCYQAIGHTDLRYVDHG